MGLIKKRSSGADLIDYTMLQKRGIIKKKAEKKMPYKVDTSGALDLTQPINTAAIAQHEVAQVTQTADSSPFGFLDSFAAAASQNSSGTSSSVTANSDSLASDVNALKLKLDDFEYKLDRFIEKISTIEEKINAFERKVG